MHRSIVTTIVVCLALFFGAVAGSFIGKRITKQNELKLLQHRQEITEHLLTAMQTVEIGAKLPDHWFETLKEEPVLLSDVLKPGSIISVIHPDCGGCLEEIRNLTENVRDTAVLNGIVFISSGNPRILKEIVELTDLRCIVLYDHRAKWLGQFDISTFPFNIVVQEDLVIKDVYAGAFMDSDLKRLASLRRIE